MKYFVKPIWKLVKIIIRFLAVLVGITLVLLADIFLIFWNLNLKDSTLLRDFLKDEYFDSDYKRIHVDIMSMGIEDTESVFIDHYASISDYILIKKTPISIAEFQKHYE